MKITNKLSLLVFCSFILFKTSVFAEMPTAQFLLFGQGARAEAMGRSVVANCKDYSSLYWNPAGSAYLRNPVLGVNATRITLKMISSYMAFIYPKEKYVYGFQALGESSQIPSYDIYGDPIPSKPNLSYKVGTTISRKYGNNLAVGAGLAIVRMELGDYKTNIAANLDIGAIYSRDRLSIGFSIANIGNRLAFETSDGRKESEEAQPTLARYGVAYYLAKNRSLLLTASMQSSIYDKTADLFGAGLEYVFFDCFALRAGLINQNSGLKPTAGFGIDYDRVTLEYSFTVSPIDYLGMDMAKLALAYRFGGEDEEARVLSEKKEKLNIAVVEFIGKSVPQEDASVVSYFLRTALVKRNAFNVVDKNNMNKLLEEAAFQMSGATDQNTVIQLGRILNVKQLVTGSVSKINGTFHINANLVDVETGQILESYDRETDSMDYFKQICELIAKKLSR